MLLAGFSRGEACKMAYAKQGQEGKTRLERLQDTARDFGHFLYNKDGENGEVQVMGRNGKSWGKCREILRKVYSKENCTNARCWLNTPQTEAFSFEMRLISFLLYFSKDLDFLHGFLWLFGGVFRLYADYIHDHGTTSRRRPEDDKIFSGKARFRFVSLFVL